MAIRGRFGSATNQAGLAMMPIILSFVIVGALVGSGMHLVGPVTQRLRTQTTQNLLDRASRSVIAWSVANGRLPAAAEFVSAAGVRDDPWHRPVVYVYDSNLATVAAGGLCGPASTALVANGVADTAFLIVSGGENLTLETTPGTSGAFAGNAVVSASDLSMVVPLTDLHNRAGCFDRTAGRLTLLNNEIPEGCSGQPYAGNLFADGGVSPYTWAATSQPGWLSLSPSGSSAQCSGMPTTPGSFTLAVTLTDALGTVVARRFEIVVTACAAGP